MVTISENLVKLPDLPQKQSIIDVTTRLWQRPDVVAVWLGGSFGSGKADRYSDVDLRIAVPPEAFSEWKQPPFDEIFDSQILDGNTWGRAAGDDAILYNLLLDTAEAYDLWIQTSERELHQEPRLILACRDEALYERLVRPDSEPRLEFDAVKPDAIRGALRMYWANHVKHEKVLHRDLYMMWRDGVYIFGAIYLRLKFILATGKDCGNVGIPPMTIHTSSPVMSILRDAYGDSLLEVVGAPITNKEECIASIDRLDAAIGDAGRAVAQRFGFDYSAEIERVVLASWAKFKERESNA